MTEEMAYSIIDEYYNLLQSADNTNDRYYYLNQCRNLLNNFPTLGEYFLYNKDAYLVASRLKKVKENEKYKYSLYEIPRFEDGIDRKNEKVFQKVSGLYFIGEVTANPITKEFLYWVKIGQSSNLAQRMRQYDSHCPTMWRIDFTDKYELEELYHKLLGTICLDRAKANEEWFRVDEKTYNELCDKGFSYFD